MPQPWLAAAGGVCAIAALVWARAAARLARAARRIEDETLTSGTSSEAANLARSGFNKDLHAAILYAVLAAGLVLASFSTSAWFEVLLLAVSVPAVFSLRYAPRFLAEARLAEQTVPAGETGRRSAGPGGPGSPALGCPPGARDPAYVRRF